MEYSNGILNFEELRLRSLPRFFDRITVVTNRIDKVVNNLSKLYSVDDWTVSKRNGTTVRAVDAFENNIDFSELCAVAKLGNIELCVTEPINGNTACSAYFKKYGEGICCIRENLSEENWNNEINRYTALKIPAIMREYDLTGETIWFDMTDIFGGLFAIHKDSPTAAERRRIQANSRKIVQINITTDNADRTVHRLSEILQVGPWSIGTLNNISVPNGKLLINGSLINAEFCFKLAITFYCNIEFEVIQPVKGPTVYQKFIDTHGIGYHHIKEVIPNERFKAALNEYQNKGFDLAICGSVSQTSFAYLDSEKAFGFYVELGDDLAPDPLPDGYNEYFYPEK